MKFIQGMTLITATALTIGAVSFVSFAAGVMANAIFDKEDKKSYGRPFSYNI